MYFVWTLGAEGGVNHNFHASFIHSLLLSLFPIPIHGQTLKCIFIYKLSFVCIKFLFSYLKLYVVFTVVSLNLGLMFTYLYYFLSCANMYWSSQTRYLLGSAVLSHWSSFTTTSTKILIISQFWFWIVMESLCFSLFFSFSCFF